MWTFLLSKTGFRLLGIAAVLIAFWFGFNKIKNQKVEIDQLRRENQSMAEGIAWRDAQINAAEIREMEYKKENENLKAFQIKEREKFSRLRRELSAGNENLKRQIAQNETDLIQLASSLAQVTTPEEKNRLMEIIKQREKEIYDLQEQIQGADCLTIHVPNAFIEQLCR